MEAPRIGSLGRHFAATLALSAFLLFSVQPMAGKQLLPAFGSAPTVWNACMLFFQAALLAGYGFAHLSLDRLGPRRQPLLALAVLGAAALALPPSVDLGRPTLSEPALEVVLRLALGFGAPFFALSTLAPTLQRWFAASRDPAAAHPYFLYAASNAGSVLGLLAYPLVLEPRLGLSAQSSAFAVAFVVLVAFVAAAAWRGRPFADPPPAAAAPRPTWARRGAWVLLSFAPSSLLLGVTTFMSTDVAAVPLLWVVPLLLYLTTFILAFLPSASRLAPPIFRLLPILLLPLVFAVLARMNRPLVLVLPLHLIGFFFAALACHFRLSELKPNPERLTEFFFFVSLGGVLGGLMNALVAPLAFETIFEYPLGIALAALLPAALGPPDSWRRGLVPALSIALGTQLLGLGLDEEARTARVLVLAALPVLLVQLLARTPRALGLALALLLVGHGAREAVGENVLHRARSFFGIHRVEVEGTTHLLVHGRTLHGLQDLAPDQVLLPLGYYHPDGPFGAIYRAIARRARPREVGLVGLGAGALACYRREGQRFVFFEIDPSVVAIARDPRLFRYLTDCPAEVVLGDARVSLAELTGPRFDLLVLDAFSSDSIPVHLMTREALRLYLARLAPGGVLAFHVSNHHLELRPILARLAADAGLVGVARQLPEAEAEGPLHPSHWIALARSPAELGELWAHPEWTRLAADPRTPLWTDDFSNVLHALQP